MNDDETTISPHFELCKQPVTTTQLVKYAGASLDFNRIHYDQEYAREAGLPGVIAHGMLTMGFMAECLTKWAGPAAFVQGISARFVKPVRPGDAVKISCRVTEQTDHERYSTYDCEIIASVRDEAVAVGEGQVRVGIRRI